MNIDMSYMSMTYDFEDDMTGWRTTTAKYWNEVDEIDELLNVCSLTSIELSCTFRSPIAVVVCITC